jgi:shikimate 5-dehydrogenase
MAAGAAGGVAAAIAKAAKASGVLVKREPEEFVKLLTRMTETNGRLYFGSIETASIGWVPAP